MLLERQRPHFTLPIRGALFHEEEKKKATDEIGPMRFICNAVSGGFHQVVTCTHTLASKYPSIKKGADATEKTVKRINRSVKTKVYLRFSR